MCGVKKQIPISQFLKELRPETVSTLEERYRSELEELGYQPEMNSETAPSKS